jgi:energy-coupling factor transport system permease protein
LRSSPSLYLARSSALHRLHPETKLAISGLAVAAGATLPGLAPVLGVFAGCLLLATSAGVARPFGRASAKAILPFLASLLVVQGLFYPGEQVLLEVGPVRVKAEGLWFAAMFSARLLAAMGAALLLLFTTRLDHLMQALARRGLSPQIAYIVVTSLQIIPRFQARAHTILDAQRSRGLDTEGSFPRRVRTLPALIGPLLLSSLLETDERAVALEARGFTRPGPKTSWSTLADSRSQRAARLVCVLAGAALLLGRALQAVAAP